MNTYHAYIMDVAEQNATVTMMIQRRELGGAIHRGAFARSSIFGSEQRAPFLL